MKTETDGDTLRLSEIPELVAANSLLFKKEFHTALGEPHRNVEVDLSQTTFVDSSGLGALLNVYKTALARQGKLVLLHPKPPVRQLLELTRLQHIFTVI